MVIVAAKTAEEMEVVDAVADAAAEEAGTADPWPANFLQH